MKHKYQKMNGRLATSDDPQRAIWYANCGYWTDEWDTLGNNTVGIPVCPVCGCPGFYCTYVQLMKGALLYQQENNPGYVQFLLDNKHTCHKNVSSLGEQWEKQKQYYKDK